MLRDPVNRKKNEDSQSSGSNSSSSCRQKSQDSASSGGLTSKRRLNMDLDEVGPPAKRFQTTQLSYPAFLDWANEMHLNPQQVCRFASTPYFKL